MLDGLAPPRRRRCPHLYPSFIARISSNIDDDAYVTKNPYLVRGLTADGLAWAFTTSRTANWHPLTWVSLLVDSQCYGTSFAGGYHLTNVLLHAANAVLLFLLLRRMTGQLWPSALVAALFAVHPLRVESVAWVTERKDVLSGLFGLLTLGHTFRTLAPGRRPLLPGCACVGAWV